MRPQTVSTFEELDKIEWFSSAHEQLADSDLIAVSSWSEVTAEMERKEWEICNISAGIRFSNGVSYANRARYNEWNNICGSIGPFVDAFVARKSSEIVAKEYLTHTVRKWISFHMFHFAMESEYSDVLPGGFFTGLAYFYKSGHLPCGWRGSFPEGKLVVF